MQERTDTLTVESLAAYSTWSDARLLLVALQELPVERQMELDKRLKGRKVGPINRLTVDDVEEHFDTLWGILQNRIQIWRLDLLQRLRDEVCVKADYCRRRKSAEFAFWAELIPIVVGILGDLGYLALSLLVIRRMLDRLCGCKS